MWGVGWKDVVKTCGGVGSEERLTGFARLERSTDWVRRRTVLRFEGGLSLTCETTHVEALLC